VVGSMGQGTKAVLEDAGVFVYRADTASEIPHVVGANNEHYGETGMQPAQTGRGTDLTGIATAAGFPKAFIVRTQEEPDELAGEVFGRDGLLFAVIKVSTAPTPVRRCATGSKPTRTGEHQFQGKGTNACRHQHAPRVDWQD